MLLLLLAGWLVVGGGCFRETFAIPYCCSAGEGERGGLWIGRCYCNTPLLD